MTYGWVIYSEGEQKEYAAVETIRHICCWNTKPFYLSNIFEQEIHDPFCFCVWFDLMLISVSWLFVFQVSEPDKDFCFFIFVLSICFCFVYLVLVVMYQRWTNISWLSFLCFFLWFSFCLLGFACGVRGVKGGKHWFAFVSVVSILFCFCLSGFGCGVRGVRGGQILLSIKSSSLPSCPSPRSEYLHKNAKMFWADIRTLDTIFTFDFFGIFGIFAPVEMFWADMCIVYTHLQQTHQQANPRVMLVIILIEIKVIMFCIFC